MGVENHNAIIATTQIAEDFDRLMLWLNDQHEILRNLSVTCHGVTNGQRTLCIVPDGSKEGWSESERMDGLRQALRDRLREDDFDDGSSCWNWVEVGFGEFGQTVIYGNNVNRYSDETYAGISD